MSFESRPLSFKLALFILPLSIMLYVSSLTMKVANVVGTVHLDTAGIEQELSAGLEGNVPVKAISDTIAGGINDVISEEFPLFANQAVFQIINRGVREKVEEKGVELMRSAMPRIDIPQPVPDVREVRLVQTIKDLWATGTTGDTFLAVALIAFTIFFPITKYIALGWLMLGTTRRSTRDRVLGWLKSWGQWSMGDVFVVAFMVVFMKINTSVVSSSKLADITVRVGVEPGMYFFAASVMSAMVCSMLLSSAEGASEN